MAIAAVTSRSSRRTRREPDRRRGAARKFPNKDNKSKASFIDGLPSPGIGDSQKAGGWLNKKFDIPGVGCFGESGHAGGMPNEQKRYDAGDRIFGAANQRRRRDRLVRGKPRKPYLGRDFFRKSS
jgi:hypothetical protein